MRDTLPTKSVVGRVRNLHLRSDQTTCYQLHYDNSRSKHFKPSDPLSHQNRKSVSIRPTWIIYRTQILSPLTAVGNEAIMRVRRFRDLRNKTYKVVSARFAFGGIAVDFYEPVWDAEADPVWWRLQKKWNDYDDVEIEEYQPHEVIHDRFDVWRPRSPRSP